MCDFSIQAISIQEVVEISDIFLRFLVPLHAAFALSHLSALRCVGALQFCYCHVI